MLLNTSILFKNKMIDVLRNHLELITDSNRMRDSAIRFWQRGADDAQQRALRRDARAETHLIPILQKHLVVLAERRAKYDTRHALETVNPLLAF